jgi:hypothetical protein
MKFLFPDCIIICYNHNHIIKLVKLSWRQGEAVAPAALCTVYSHRINISITEGPLSGATCSRFFMQKYAVYWPEGGAASQCSVFIGQKMSLTG